MGVVTEAAEALGVARQAEPQRLMAGILPGTKVGSTRVLQAAAIKG